MTRVYSLCKAANAMFNIVNVAPAVFINIQSDNETTILPSDYIGGITNGNKTGIAVIDDIFPTYQLIPTLLCVPGQSDSTVINALVSRARNINGHFTAEVVADCKDQTNGYLDISNWKSSNSLTDTRLLLYYPHVKIGEDIYPLSVLACSVMSYIDSTHNGFPVQSPSNLPIRINGICKADGTNIILDKSQCDYLNAVGVSTALNWRTWRVWGNNTANYGVGSDVKDTITSFRRTLDYLQNNFVLTFWDRIDRPITKRLIDAIVNSYNQYLNSLQSSNNILGARIEFRQEDNPSIDLLTGKVVFRIYYLPAPAASEIEAVFEIDPNYFSNLF